MFIKELRKNSNALKIRIVVLVTLAALISGCASSTVIRSTPEGAAVYIDNIKKGTTPYQYSDTALAGTVKPIILKKDGYKPLDAVIRKDKFQAGPCFGGLFFLFPFAWILGYDTSYEFELEAAKTQ